MDIPRSGHATMFYIYSRGWARFSVTPAYSRARVTQGRGAVLDDSGQEKN